MGGYGTRAEPISRTNFGRSDQPDHHMDGLTAAIGLWRKLNHGGIEIEESLVEYIERLQAIRPDDQQSDASE